MRQRPLRALCLSMPITANRARLMARRYTQRIWRIIFCLCRPCYHMLLSMTGYGKTESQFRNRTLVCEVRSLNSKALDLSVRIAPTLRAKELDIRTQI
ncbi:MAG: hypothetical protein IIV43_00785, partial [Oscillospiraceae bacterium]|nr:hypothetical protein [Oscillospiraceae bacterium]